MTLPAKGLKYVLAAFVAVSIGTAVYKMLPCCDGSGNGQSAPVEAAAVSAAAEDARPVQEAKQAPAAKPQKKDPVKGTPGKTAVVYYFYTTARCYSCNMIEKYTREAVEKHFDRPYNGWEVTFKGVNVDEKENEHFTKDYWLSSKSVVVQKFNGEKPLNWGLLKSVWQLLGDKDKFMNYIAVETRKVLDAE